MSSVALQGVYDETMTYENGNQFAGDDKLFVTFSTRAVKNEFKSNLEGRPIFYEEEYIRIIVPGSRDILESPLDDQYKRRFASRYKAWKDAKGEEQKVEGTILSEVTWLTKSMVAELNAMNIFTVEQLAAVPDNLAVSIMGNQQLRQRARNFVEAAKGEAPMLKLQQELEQRDLRIQSLERKIGELSELLAKQQRK